MNYAENGFTIVKSSQILNRVNNINKLLCDLLGLVHNSNTFLADVHVELTEIFKDKELYFGFLKAFTNAPEVQEISATPDLLKAVRDCGVEYPTLVTPPILHVVAKDLIVNEAKVFTPAHQDVVSTKGSVGQVVIWIPLHDVEENNFGISAIAGSHKMGELETDPSEFGHTVKPNLIDGLSFDYLKLSLGDSVIFSQYLVHNTHTLGNFRMALSFRFNDMKDDGWRKRKYFIPFERVPVKQAFEDKREKAPQNPRDYFRNLN